MNAGPGSERAAGGVDAAIRLSNAFTGRWCAAIAEPEFVVSGACTWPVLALLASVADGEARTELTAAAWMTAGIDPGSEPGRGRAEALALLGLIDAAEPASAALGLWVHAAVPIEPAFAGDLPPGVIGALTGVPQLDKERLDEWVRANTAGLIERMPVTVDASILLVLATALAARTRWEHEFTEPYGESPLLSRVTAGLDDVALLAGPAGPVTRCVVRGDNGLDVHLLTADGAPPGAGDRRRDRLACRANRRTPGAAFDEHTRGPGLAAYRTASTAPQDVMQLRVPAFAIDSDHDLLQYAELCGLVAAQDVTRGHFPLLSRTGPRGRAGQILGAGAVHCRRVRDRRGHRDRHAGIGTADGEIRRAPRRGHPRPAVLLPGRAAGIRAGRECRGGRPAGLTAPDCQDRAVLSVRAPRPGRPARCPGWPR